MVAASHVLDIAGIDDVLYSAGPAERLMRFFEEELAPRIRSRTAEFQQWFQQSADRASTAVRKETELLLLAQRELSSAVRNYVVGMKEEGLGGELTARVVILTAAFDALMKLFSSEGPFDPSTITQTDLLMLALAAIRLRRDLFPRTKCEE
jgi:hypothetical protein